MDKIKNRSSEYPAAFTHVEAEVVVDSDLYQVYAEGFHFSHEWHLTVCIAKNGVEVENLRWKVDKKKSPRGTKGMDWQRYLYNNLRWEFKIIIPDYTY